MWRGVMKREQSSNVNCCKSQFYTLPPTQSLPARPLPTQRWPCALPPCPVRQIRTSPRKGARFRAEIVMYGVLLCSSYRLHVVAARLES